jgi:hypothetical protein
MPWHPTLINSEILAVHAALVPVGSKGTVVMFGGDEHNAAQGGNDDTPADPANVDRTALFDVNTRAVARTSSPTTDVFCSGHAFASDGRLVVAGGTESWGGADPGGPGGGHVHQHGNFGGHRASWVYSHAQNSWTRVGDLGFQDGPGQGGGRWYPSVLTLASGDLLAMGGHPSRLSDHWHENDLPERYLAGGGFWIWYGQHIGFEHPSLPGNWYPRFCLVRGGWVFIITRHNNECRFFDPNTGNLVGPAVVPPPAPYNVGWDYATVLLPLVPGDSYRARVLAVNGPQPMRIELDLGAGAPTPTWVNAGARQGSAAGKSRTFACPVYLPTGQVLVSGGINGIDDASAVKEPEIYTPDINWTTRTYGAGAGTWQTVAEPAQIARNYHSTALLLPDGSVFTAGSNINAQSGDPAVVGQRNIELFFPAYFSDPARPELTGAPTVLNYANTSFVVTAGSAAQAGSIRTVALIRCGSVTHASDYDQRYVALVFTQEAGTANLTVELPNDATVLPPGHYMIWIVDQNNLPCRQARFVRIAHQSSIAVTDRSTFSREEVAALAGVMGGTATFDSAIYVQYDGFTPSELGAAPTVSVRWADTNTAVAAADFSIVQGPRLQEVSPGSPDTAQRISYAFHVRFLNMNAFAGFTDRRSIRVTFTQGVLSCDAVLDLTHAPNPYMTDVNPGINNPPWLSTDVRVFSIEAGQTKFGSVMQSPNDPIGFVRGCLDKLNDPNQNGRGLFENLSRDATLDLASNGPPPASPLIYNYAIAQVRYRAQTTVAQRVKCFFRLFNVAATGLEFDPDTTYRRTVVGPNTVPLLGTPGGEIASIPFFASQRVETVQGQPGAASMATQPLDPVLEVRDIAPNAMGFEVTSYFGCWLDINQTRRRMPIAPGASDGPWPESACRSIQELVRGRHQCVVAEVFFEPDPTNRGATPGTSDNLSQRNLAILNSDNPGGPDSHTVMHTFEVKPSVLPALKGTPFDWDVPKLAVADFGRQFRLDELAFRWHNLPPRSEVTVYFSDIDTREIQMLAALRRSPLACEVVDQHTLRFTVAGLTWIPIPGGRTLNIPALLSVKLPDNVTYGQVFRVSIHQVSGRDRRIIGSCDFRIPVSKAELILDEEVRSLSVLKHVATTIPTDNRWYPLMQRYVHHLGLKVDALGGDARAVNPNPDGSGRPYEPKAPGEQPFPDPGTATEPGGGHTFTGLVADVYYDCHGRFQGFRLESCGASRRFRGCEPSLEALVLRACRERSSVTVLGEGERIMSIKVHCC